MDVRQFCVLYLYVVFDMCSLTSRTFEPDSTDSSVWCVGVVWVDAATGTGDDVVASGSVCGEERAVRADISAEGAYPLLVMMLVDSGRKLSVANSLDSVVTGVELCPVSSVSMSLVDDFVPACGPVTGPGTSV